MPSFFTPGEKETIFRILVEQVLDMQTGSIALYTFDFLNMLLNFGKKVIDGLCIFSD